MDNSTNPDIKELAKSIRALFAAILTRALKDIFKPTYSDQEIYKSQALYWLTVNDFDSFTSFINICSYLDIDVDNIRRIVNAELIRLERGFPQNIKFNLGFYKLRFEYISPHMMWGGNPADTELVETMLDRQKRIYGRYPLKVALDGGFASKDNLAKAKERRIKDVCFSKKRGLKEADMCRSDYVYKKLRQFRAGIESGISWLKRSFGLTRCTWKGFRSFKSYVLSSVVAANLLTMARKKLATV